MRPFRLQPRAPRRPVAAGALALAATGAGLLTGVSSAATAPPVGAPSALAQTAPSASAEPPALALAPSGRSASLTTSVAAVPAPGVPTRAPFSATAAAQATTPPSPWTPGPTRPFSTPAKIEYLNLYPAGAKATLARIGLDIRASNPASAFASVAADGTVGTLHRVPSRLYLVGGPAFDRRGRGVVAVQTGRDTLSWASISRAGVIGPLHRLGQMETGARTVVDDDGNLAIAWVDRNTPYRDRETGGARVRIRVALRPAGGAFRKTETLPLAATYAIPDPTVAIDDGRVVVGAATAPWSGPSQVLAWTGTVRSGLGARLLAGRQRSDTSLNSFVGRSGLVVLAWATQSRGEEISSGVAIRAAALRPGARRFGPMRELDPGGPAVDTSSYAFIVGDTRGGATLAWDNGRKGGTRDVSLATVDRAGRISARRTIAANATGVSLAAGPRGAALLTWGDVSSADRAGRALYRAPGEGRFEPVEGLPAGFSSKPFFWPGSGRPLVASVVPPAVEGGDPGLVFAARAGAPAGR